MSMCRRKEGFSSIAHSRTSLSDLQVSVAAVTQATRAHTNPKYSFSAFRSRRFPGRVVNPAVQTGAPLTPVTSASVSVSAYESIHLLGILPSTGFICANMQYTYDHVANIWVIRVVSALVLFRIEVQTRFNILVFAVVRVSLKDVAALFWKIVWLSSR